MEVLPGCYLLVHPLRTRLYFFFPETARLSLEGIPAKFGDDVAVHVNDVSEEQRRGLDSFLKAEDVVHMQTGVKYKRGQDKYRGEGLDGIEAT